MKIIVGSGGTAQHGWVPLEFSDLDIRDRRQWRQRFWPGSIDAVLAEHVLEHLYPWEGEQTARNVFEFLKTGGYWRIAVPDAFNPNPAYHEHSRPGGQYQTNCQPIYGDGPPHRCFYDIESLTTLLETVGFRVRPIEWFTRDGIFRRANWNHADGFVKRSVGTEHVANMRILLGFDNTSLIVDAVKP